MAKNSTPSSKLSNPTTCTKNKFYVVVFTACITASLSLVLCFSGICFHNTFYSAKKHKKHKPLSHEDKYSIETLDSNKIMIAENEKDSVTSILGKNLPQQLADSMAVSMLTKKIRKSVARGGNYRYHFFLLKEIFKNKKSPIDFTCNPNKTDEEDRENAYKCYINLPSNLQLYRMFEFAISSGTINTKTIDNTMPVELTNKPSDNTDEKPALKPKRLTTCYGYCIDLPTITSAAFDGITKYINSGSSFLDSSKIGIRNKISNLDLPSTLTFSAFNDLLQKGNYEELINIIKKKMYERGENGLKERTLQNFKSLIIALQRRQNLDVMLDELACIEEDAFISYYSRQYI